VSTRYVKNSPSKTGWHHGQSESLVCDADGPWAGALLLDMVCPQKPRAGQHDSVAPAGLESERPRLGSFCLAGLSVLRVLPAEFSRRSLGRPFTREELQAARQLRWVQILNTGAEGVVPLLKNTNITLSDLKVVLGPEVADHAVALLLSLTRGLYLTIPEQRKHEWERPDNLGQLIELRGKTAVIVGVGGVGTQIAERVAAFGMTIIGVDPKDSAPASSIKEMVKPNQIDTVLPLADVVFITVPETPATKGMIGTTQFLEMKRGAYFIAVSRGAVYSMDGLVEALAKRRLAGAGLDVTDPEPLPSKHPLWKFKNVVITPHIAGASDGALARVLDLLQENIRRFAADQPLLNTIDKNKGY
jgi:D-2-hydroxyacid dehydrogenase (NADP+)